MWSYDEVLGDYVQQLDTQVTGWRLPKPGWDRSYLVRFFRVPTLTYRCVRPTSPPAKSSSLESYSIGRSTFFCSGCVRPTPAQPFTLATPTHFPLFRSRSMSTLAPPLPPPQRRECALCLFRPCITPTSHPLQGAATLIFCTLCACCLLRRCFVLPTARRRH